ncbi:DUF3168 domain-containing protein [Jiella avicenniae]|uniref:DUF3168 domain-containing protein n=1 Tax=Jiella avicenniae TaxID=2907202 RepID=A0A9X1P438_9HYPH|nr:DUF3168 domain-containing protein [Jiella avicenniae]MCE7028926.1 DUF3168 domain-containing protein [Jiella avicenniae]
MIEPSRELQRAIRATLIADPAVVALVEPNMIRDAGTRPEKFPTIIHGEGQTVLEQITFSRKHVRCYLDLHVWTFEEGLSQAKIITGAVTNALATQPVINGFHLVDFLVSGCRFLRDPSGNIGHAVISTEALVEAAE